MNLLTFFADHLPFFIIFCIALFLFLNYVLDAFKIFINRNKPEVRCDCWSEDDSEDEEDSDDE